MNKMTLALFIALCSAPVLAQQGGFSDQNAPQTQGGFSSSNTAPTTVDKISSLNDDAWVILQGNIEERVGEDNYTFRDATGTIVVDIDRKRWGSQTITPKDRVQLEGKVDKDWNRVEVDVKNIKKLP